MSSENEGDPQYDSNKEFWKPCTEEWVETASFIFKDSCSRGVGVKSMQGLYLVSSLLFVHVEKTAVRSPPQTSMEIMFRGIEHRDNKMAGMHSYTTQAHTNSHQCCSR